MFWKYSHGKNVHLPAIKMETVPSQGHYLRLGKVKIKEANTVEETNTGSET